jgi:hypothetical protein
MTARDNWGMAKRPPPGKCVHCLREGAERNWDHVFPIGWYPETTPEDIEKWKVPSCVQCNSHLGRLESRFISLIALTLDPNAREAAGIPQKVLRSLKPDFARDEADARARTAAAKRVTGSLYRGTFAPENVYPTAGAAAARNAADPIPLLIPADLFAKITEKIVRGITYVQTGKFIEPPLSVNFVPDGPDMPASEFAQVIRMHGTALERGPGIKINFVIAPEDGVSGFFEIVFWGGQFKTYAAVHAE